MCVGDSVCGGWGWGGGDREVKGGWWVISKISGIALNCTKNPSLRHYQSEKISTSSKICPNFLFGKKKNVRGKLFIYFITNSFFPIYPCALNYIRGKGAFNILNYVSKGAF